MNAWLVDLIKTIFIKLFKCQIKAQLPIKCTLAENAMNPMR